MGTARFHVFSGTGNSLFVAERLAQSLTKEGWATRILPVTADSLGRGPGLAQPASGDLDLFVFPVYALSVPHLMDRYMAALGRVGTPGAKKPRAVVLATNGRISPRFRDGHEGQSLAQADRILRRRGWEVVYRQTFDLPQNITSFINAQSLETQKAILDLMEARLEATARDLWAGTRFKRKAGFFSHLLGWPFGFAYRLLGRRAWARLYAADERCNSCGLCAAQCPAKALRMVGGKPDWSYACEGCQGCINRCPRQAIQTSLVRLGLMVALVALVRLPGKALVATLATSALPFLPSLALDLCWTVLEILAGLGAFRLLDLGLQGLSHIPGLGAILGFGWTRWYRRYAGPRP